MHGFRIGRHELQPYRQLLADGERVHLGARALAILSVLAEAKGEIVTKDELMDAVWPDVIVEENALQVHVVALRKALDEDSDRLKTIRGVGYLLEVKEYLGDQASPASDTRSQVEAYPRISPATSSPPSAIEAAQIASRSSGGRNRMLAGALVAAAILLAGLFWLAGRDLNWGLFTGGASPQVTVMPLEALSSDAEQVAFAAGITDELVNRLRRVTELQVATGLPGEANEGKTLRGSVRTDGDQMRLTARLENNDGTVLWSQNFDREVTDLLSVQQEIAASVANALSVSLDVGIDSRRYGGTNNPEAYLNYVRGRLNRLNTERSYHERYLERAVQLDPDYVRAWAELSVAYGISRSFAETQAEAKDLLAKQGEAASRTLQAGPELWLGQAARGWSELASGNISAAAERHRRVEELDPGNDPDLREVLANFAHNVGRVGDALEWRRSKELIDPIYRLDPYRFEDLVLNRRYEEAIQLYNDLADAGVEVPHIPAESFFWAYLLNGDVDEARQLARRIGLGRPYTQLPREAFDEDAFPDLPREQLAAWAARRFPVGGREALGRLANYAGYLGRPELAMTYLELAYQRPSIGSFNLVWHPTMAAVRRSERFEGFLEQKGFVSYWRETGDWADFCRPISETEIECT